ncbi:hypothetical protein N2152v2_003890 [Parachlorella kessleri]
MASTTETATSDAVIKQGHRGSAVTTEAALGRFALQRVAHRRVVLAGLNGWGRLPAEPAGPGEATRESRRRLLQEGTPTVAVSEGVLQPSSDGPSAVNYITFQDLVPPGPAVVKAHVVDSVEACWQECLAGPPCNVFAYCNLEGGCNAPAANLSSVAHRGCELRHQPSADPENGLPVQATPVRGFVGGYTAGRRGSGQLPVFGSAALQLLGGQGVLVPAAVTEAALTSPVPRGYEERFFTGYYNRLNYQCEGSEMADVCILTGTPLELAPRCTADPRCVMMQYQPLGRELSGPNRTLFKGGLGVTAADLENSNWNQNAIVYFSPDALVMSQEAAAGAGGGLSGGAIAGIVVGSVLGVACAAAAAYGFVRWHRRAAARHRDLGKGPLPDGAHQQPLGPGESAFAAAAAPAGIGVSAFAAAAGMARSSSGALPAAADGGQNGEALTLKGGLEDSALVSQGGSGGSSATPGARAPALLQRTAGRAHSAHVLDDRIAGSFSVLPASRAASLQMALMGGGAQRSPGGSGSRSTSGGRPALNGGGSGGSSRLREQQPQHGQQAQQREQLWGSPFQQQPGEGWGAAASASSASAGRSRQQSLEEPLPEEAAINGDGGDLPVTLAKPLTPSAILFSYPNREWQTRIVPFEALQFAQNEDGSLVELGSGAFGSIFKVLLDGVQPLAAKVLDLGLNRDMHEVFIQEACMLQRLRHRNIVGFAGVCVHEGRGILLMELMEGRDLHSVLGVRNKTNKQRTFSWYNRGKRVLVDVAMGLYYLHREGCTHFDIKSPNVLLSRDLTAKLADVGFTRMLTNTHHSVSGAHAGTFAYVGRALLGGWGAAEGAC